MSEKICTLYIKCSKCGYNTPLNFDGWVCFHCCKCGIELDYKGKKQEVKKDK